MSRKLTCPQCREKFTNVKIEGGCVRCPCCNVTIFQYRFPEDSAMTPREFLSTLDTRGTVAARSLRQYFPNIRATAANAFAAASMVSFMWPILAQTFEKEDEQAS